LEVIKSTDKPSDTATNNDEKTLPSRGPSLLQRLSQYERRMKRANVVEEDFFGHPLDSIYKRHTIPTGKGFIDPYVFLTVLKTYL
jgi:hypothetical protein